jgi:hypothetical protein
LRVDLDGAVVEITNKRSPARERIADRNRHIALGGEVLKRPIEPAPQVFDDRPGAGLSNCEPDFRPRAAHLLFDGIEFADAANGFGCGGRIGSGKDVVYNLRRVWEQQAASTILPPSWEDENQHRHRPETFRGMECPA